MAEHIPDSGAAVELRAQNPAGLPHRWGRVVIGLAAVTLVAILLAALLFAFLRGRPLDLTVPAMQLSVDVHELLVAAGIPGQNITRSSPRVREGPDGSHWTFTQFEAVAPPGVEPETLLSVLRSRLAANPAVSVTVANDSSGGLNLAFALDGRPVVQASIRHLPPEREVRRDLTQAAARLAGAVEEAMLALDPAPHTLERDPPEPREDRVAVWRAHTLRPAWAEPPAPAQLAALLRAAVGAREIEVKTDEDGQVSIEYLGFPCVLVVPEAVAPPVLPGEQTGAAEANAVDSGPDEGPAEYEAPPEEDVPLNSAGAPKDVPDTAPPPDKDAAEGIKRAAIILDDGGYGGYATEIILGLDPVFTLAILPFTPFSEETARRATELGFEVIVHMPMESANKKVGFPGELTVEMDAETIRAQVDKALATVPGAIGMNNHQGSTFTSNAEKMGEFLEYLQELDLFFVDSLTAATSKAYHVARALGVPTARRHVFLDNKADSDYILEQFELFIERCHKRGSAVAIGHFRPLTAELLVDILPRFAEEGIELVHVSELLE